MTVSSGRPSLWRSRTSARSIVRSMSVPPCMRPSAQPPASRGGANGWGSNDKTLSLADQYKSVRLITHTDSYPALFTNGGAGAHESSGLFGAFAGNTAQIRKQLQHE